MLLVEWVYLTDSFISELNPVNTFFQNQTINGNIIDLTHSNSKTAGKKCWKIQRKVFFILQCVHVRRRKCSSQIPFSHFVHAAGVLSKKKTH